MHEIENDTEDSICNADGTGRRHSDEERARYSQVVDNNDVGISWNFASWRE
jgi:hypothetical protein